MKVTLHVTDLDSWLWYNRIEDMTAEELVGRLLRTAPANDQMRMGTAWHSIMERPPEDIQEISMDGFQFVVNCDFKLFLPQSKEIRACKTYLVDGVEVKLTGKCDGITGNTVIDHKLTFKPDPENYLTSYQWRAYLDIFNADVFEYVIYSAKADGNRITINDISTMKLYRYPNMVNDLVEGIRQLVCFVKTHVPQKMEV